MAGKTAIGVATEEAGIVVRERVALLTRCAATTRAAVISTRLQFLNSFRWQSASSLSGTVDQLTLRADFALFLERLPGIERLVFNDGTRLADDTTLEWIARHAVVRDLEAQARRRACGPRRRRARAARRARCRGQSPAAHTLGTRLDVRGEATTAARAQSDEQPQGRGQAGVRAGVSVIVEGKRRT
ncbi:type VI secretion system domain-containing protein [Caballeronia catudaia]|uniref:type VI secretion system domain-containing protein n=1 Tax=Caballeronia catudaia TaxID=1777136 RepID=UPI001359FCDB